MPSKIFDEECNEKAEDNGKGEDCDSEYVCSSFGMIAAPEWILELGTTESAWLIVDFSKELAIEDIGITEFADSASIIKMVIKPGQ